MAKRDDIDYLLSKLSSMSTSMDKLESAIGASSKSTKSFDSSLNNTSKYTQATNVSLAAMANNTQKTVMALGSLNTGVIAASKNISLSIPQNQGTQTPSAQQGSQQQPQGGGSGAYGSTFAFILAAIATLKSFDSLPDLVKDLITGSIPAVLTKVLAVASESISRVSQVQSKAFASNINVEGLVKSDIATRSRLVDVQDELVKFRELGILKFNDSTVKLADRMVFTGQRIGSLAKFIAETGLAMNLNTQQSESLAQTLVDSTKLYGIQQDVLFEAINSMDEVLTKVAAFTGSGKEVASLVADYTAKFGANYADDIKTMLQFLLGEQGQRIIRAYGLAPEVNKLFTQQLSKEDFQKLAQSIVSISDRIAPNVSDVLKFPVVSRQLESLNMNEAQRVAARNLAMGKAVEKQVEDAYKKFTLQDVINALMNNVDKMTTATYEGLNESLKKANFSVDKFRALIDVMFDAVRTFITMSISGSTTAIGELLKGIGVAPETVTQIQKFIDTVNTKIEQIPRADIDKPKEITKEDNIYRAREQQLKQFNPEQTSESTGFLAQMTSHLKDLKDNSDEQMKKFKYPAGRFMESPAMSRSV